MSPIKLVIRTVFILSSISTSFAAICNDQTRASGNFSEEKLTALLDSNEKISNFCSEDVTGKTSGSINFSNFKISFNRIDSAKSTLEHCTEAFEDIISQCIEPSSSGTYGGSLAFNNGEIYTMVNEIYPQTLIASVSLEKRSVKKTTKKASKATQASTTKTSPKTTMKATEATKTTEIPMATKTISKATETSKIAPSSTNSKATEPVSTTLKSTTFNSILSKTSSLTILSLSSTKSSIKESQTSTNSVAEFSVSSSSLSSLSSTQTSVGEKITDTHSAPTSGVSKTKTSSLDSSTKTSSLETPSVTPTGSSSIKSTVISSNTHESTLSNYSSSARGFTIPSSVAHSSISSKLATPTSEVPSKITEPSSTDTVSSSGGSISVKTSGAHSSEPTVASSRIDSITSSKSVPVSGTSHSFSFIQTGSFSSGTNTAFKSSAVSSSIPNSSLTSSNSFAQSSNAEESNAVPTSLKTSDFSSASLTSSTQPEITPSPHSSSSWVSGAITSTSSSDVTSPVTSTGSLTTSAEPEITPPLSDKSSSELSTEPETSTSGPGFLSQAISVGSVAFSVATEISASPTDSPTSEATDPSETSPDTTEISSTDSALISATAASSPTSTSPSTCSATAGESCSICCQYSGSGDISSSSNATGVKTRSLPLSIAGRISIFHLHSRLAKRDADSFTSFDAANSCVFSSVETPSIPDASNLVSEAGHQTQFWYVLQNTAVNGSTCPVLGFTEVTDGALASQLISSNAVGYTKAGPGVDWKADAPTVNVDSVYEPSILREFFASKVNSNNCAAFKAIFDQPNAGDGGKTILQNIWDQLPSDINPDVAGMDQKIGIIKAQAFQGVSQNLSSKDEKLAYISELAVAIALTNNDNIASIFKSTNLRIYQVLLSIDTIIGAANTSTASLIKPDWASTYRAYLSNLLTTRSSAINSQVSSYLNNDLGVAVRSDHVTSSDGTSSTTENSIGNGVDAFLKAYPLPSSFTFDQEKLLGFPGV